MKYNTLRLAVIWIAIMTTGFVNRASAGAGAETQDIEHSLLTTKNESSTCNIDSVYVDTLVSRSSHVKIDQNFPAALEYFNDDVTGTYNSMRDKVISHVKAEVIASLFNLNVNGFAPENIAAYVSEATKPFLPFKFANGVRIIDVTHKEGTIVYKAEIPMHKNHNHALLLTKAAIASASTTVCNDSTLVEDLLERKIIIQYDYYDSNGVYMCSFNIKDGHSKQI
ncbi:MAG: hypothetical protein GQ475_04085 [Methylococcaceae bacterium]|nr:hypothetical protein [Methylococcaceae bacterium]